MTQYDWWSTMRHIDWMRFINDPLFEPQRLFLARERKAHWLDSRLGRFAWWRKRRGGHWEQWAIDVPVASDLWFPVACTRGTRARPPLGRGTPCCEDR